MVSTKAHKKAVMKYEKATVKRVPLNLRIDDQYPALKAAAEAAGETISGYIKNAIRQRMAGEGRQLDADLEEVRQRKADRLSEKDQ